MHLGLFGFIWRFVETFGYMFDVWAHLVHMGEYVYVWVDIYIHSMISLSIYIYIYMHLEHTNGTNQCIYIIIYVETVLHV